MYAMIITSIVSDVYDNIINISLSRSALSVRRRTNIVIRLRVLTRRQNALLAVYWQISRTSGRICRSDRSESVIINNCPILMLRAGSPSGRRYLQPTRRHCQLIIYIVTRTLHKVAYCSEWISLEPRKVEHGSFLQNNRKLIRTKRTSFYWSI